MQYGKIIKIKDRKCGFYTTPYSMHLKMKYLNVLLGENVREVVESSMNLGLPLQVMMLVNIVTKEYDGYKFNNIAGVCQLCIPDHVTASLLHVIS